jgi:hypothetical protein
MQTYIATLGKIHADHYYSKSIGVKLDLATFPFEPTYIEKNIVRGLASCAYGNYEEAG